MTPKFAAVYDPFDYIPQCRYLWATLWPWPSKDGPK